jgi:AbrB family looped-hinge helix DNA binding protein
VEPNKDNPFRDNAQTSTAHAPMRTKLRVVSMLNLCYNKTIDMATVTVSPKFQIVIPKEIREGLALAPGDKVEIVQLEDRIELVPLRPIESLEGFLKGVRNTFKRESDRCLP